MKRCAIFLLLSSMMLHAFTWDDVKNSISNGWKSYKNYSITIALNGGWVGPAFEQAIYLCAEAYQLTEITDEKLCAFVREQLAHAGVETPERITIRRGSGSSYCAGINYIAMSDDNYHELKTVLETMDSLVDDPYADQERIAQLQLVIDVHTAVIHHEAAHLRYNDNIADLCVLLAAGFTFDAVWNKIAPALGAEKYVSGREDYSDTSLLRVSALSLARNVFCKLIKCIHAQMQEWRADGNIAQDIRVLKGAQKFFEYVHGSIKKRWSDLGIDLDTYPVLSYITDPNHPRAALRVAAIAERIAALSNETI
jgi:hypothetical protein